MSMLDDTTTMKELCYPTETRLSGDDGYVVTMETWENRFFKTASELFEASMLKQLPPGNTELSEKKIENILANKAKACIEVTKIFMGEYRKELCRVK